MSCIAVDAMSGEKDPAAAVGASLRMAREHPDIEFHLCGKEKDILAAMRSARRRSNISIVDASEVVGMNEPPVRAIRKRNTSMRRAMELVAKGTAQAAVSAGNTGALLGIGMLEVGVVDGIQRPAIASFMPNNRLEGGCCMLDLGANTQCSAEMLREFALMGASLTSVVRGVSKPSVGLLNVGEEHFKGGEILQQAAALIKQTPHIDFQGNVEGFDIFLGNCDVIVCDGFTGNVALKASEGLARMISGNIRQTFRRNLPTRVWAALAAPMLASLRKQMDARRYNGACFLGLQGLVVKSHGNADKTAFYSALDYAVRAGRSDLAGVLSSMLQTAAAAA